MAKKTQSADEAPKLAPGTKFNEGKTKLHLVDPAFVQGMVTAVAYGAEKYEAWNWLGGFPFGDCWDSIVRHLNAWWAGEELDPENGIHHLDEAAAQLMFLRRMVVGAPERYQHLDDRPNWEEHEVRDE